MSMSSPNNTKFQLSTNTTSATMGGVSASSPMQSLTINNFNNVLGQTISFDLEGVSLSFIATGTDDQAGNAAALKSAMDTNSAALTAAGISYLSNSDGTGIEVTKSDLSPVDLSNYIGNANIIQFT